MPTYYQILSIPETASQQEIKSAFRRLSLQYHPDRNNGDKYAEAKFREVLEAYKLLSDPDKKAWYDRRLFYQRQPTPQSQPQPQPQPASSPVYRRRNARQILTDYYGTNDEYVQPDFSRMPWKFMGIMIVGFILFFVLLYNFGPTAVNEELLADAQQKELPAAKLENVPRNLKLKDSTWSSVAAIIAQYPDADVTELYPDIDGNGVKDLQLAMTYREDGAIINHDFFFRNLASFDHEEKIDHTTAIFEEFFAYKGGTYLVGFNIRLYFDQSVETYHSCASCSIGFLPNKVVPGIYLKIKNGTLRFAETNERRNFEITENLAYLKTLDIPELNEGKDDGTRKEYVRLIVSYYFNNRDSRATEALFRKYYDGKDADTVWEDASGIIKTYAQKITSNAAFHSKEVF